MGLMRKRGSNKLLRVGSKLAGSPACCCGVPVSCAITEWDLTLSGIGEVAGGCGNCAFYLNGVLALTEKTTCTGVGAQYMTCGDFASYNNCCWELLFNPFDYESNQPCYILPDPVSGGGITFGWIIQALLMTGNDGEKYILVIVGISCSGCAGQTLIAWKFGPFTADVLVPRTGVLLSDCGTVNFRNTQYCDFSGVAATLVGVP